MSRAQIGEIVGVHGDTVGRWLKAYEVKGSKALKLKTRGRREGSGRRLDADQERRIQKLLIDKTPDQLMMPYALWTREAVRELVKDQLDVALPTRTLGHYLRRWGMTPQKPVKHAYKQQPARVQQWLDEEYPHIQAKAKAEAAEIYWGGEGGFRDQVQHERGYALKGNAPVIRTNVRRESVNMISAIENQGKVRFKLFEGRMNAADVIDFLKRLRKDAQRKVILIQGNLRVHHAKTVKAWLASKVERIEIFYLPLYSPARDPDDCFNSDMKAGVHPGKPARAKAQQNNGHRAHADAATQIGSRQEGR